MGSHCAFSGLPPQHCSEIKKKRNLPRLGLSVPQLCIVLVQQQAFPVPWAAECWLGGCLLDLLPVCPPVGKMELVDQMLWGSSYSRGAAIPVTITG